ncbi:MAG: hypothetical protein NTV72_02155 [Candidatus Taylorbacteria bacterium]|nr:hypothetical protein [Candidatus Taylorbacteria bacterium]
MKIKWNKITWYSIVLTVIIFLGIVPFLTFYFIGQYKEIVTSSTVNINFTTSEVKGWKTYNNYAFGFSLKIPENNAVYACRSNPIDAFRTKPTIANEKDYWVFVLENPNDIGLIKSCASDQLSKFKHFSIDAHEASKGEYTSFVDNWEKGYADKKYMVTDRIMLDGHNALSVTKVDTVNNFNSYKEIIIDGGKYFYHIDLPEKSNLLERIISTFESIIAKDKVTDWSILANKDLGFEIKYPYNYASGILNGQIPGSLGWIIQPTPPAYEGGPRFFVLVKKLDSDISLDRYVDSLNIKDTSGLPHGYININGISWFKYTYKVESEFGDYVESSYITIKNGYIYELKHVSAEAGDTFEKVANTFKFTDPTK